MELGLYTFVEGDAASGDAGRRRMRELLEEVELAEQVGLDVFGIGEHHRRDFVVSAPAVALAAAAARSERIRLTSAVTVLSSDDPIRVFQDFATIDLISGGRAEIMAGRGSFTESFPLFGFDLDQYDELFASKLERLLHIRDGGLVHGMEVYPRPVQDPLPVWLAVGGNPQSVVRAAALNLPLAIAIIGGLPERFKPFADGYRHASEQLGRTPGPVSINAHGFVGDPDDYFPSYARMMTRIGRERGWPPMSRAQFDQGTSLRGAYAVGEPEAVAEKILFQHEVFAHDRFLLQMSVGDMPHAKVLRSIERFGSEVAPLVREEVARRTATSSRPEAGQPASPAA
jgi:probable LLM family oxidoreductase